MASRLRAHETPAGHVAGLRLGRRRGVRYCPNVPLSTRAAVRRVEAPTPFPPGSEADLVARWIRWVATQAEFRGPIRDKTGKYAGRAQPANLWFLAGNAGGSSERTCTIPAGRPLFFPTVNLWEIGGAARRGMPVVEGAEGEATLDGVYLPVRPMGTPRHFLVRGALGNPITFFPVPFPVSCWGLWVHLAPLAPGHHELRFRGATDASFDLDVSYHLDVR